MRRPVPRGVKTLNGAGAGATTGRIARRRLRASAPIAGRRRWFGGFLQIRHWNRDMMRSPRFGALGLAVMPVKAIDTLQPFYGLSAFALLLGFLATDRIYAVFPAGGLALAKIGLDVANMVLLIAADCDAGREIDPPSVVYTATARNKDWDVAIPAKGVELDPGFRTIR